MKSVTGRVRARAILVPAVAVFATCLATEARASSPLEYPDNGSAAFSRGGAWLAVANEPIATHYNPAALATQPTALSIEQQLNFPHTCFDRRGPGNTVTGPDVTATPQFTYQPVCSGRGSFPIAIPSIALAFRLSRRVGLGMAVVPPATYGTSDGQFPLLANGTDTKTGQPRLLPAPYRYLQVDQRSTILFPTASVGYEVARNFRVGVGFVSGIGVIDTSTVGVSNLAGIDAAGDHMKDDAFSSVRTADWFVPGAVVAMHWSVVPKLDIALWGRFMDAIRSNSGETTVDQQTFDGNGQRNPPCAGVPSPGGALYGTCGANQAIPNRFPNAIAHFKYAVPPEVRLGMRFHEPRTRARVLLEDGALRRDPLHDDVFDVEVDESFTFNSVADTIEVRFQEKNGDGALLTQPLQVPLPPNADRPTGYKDSLGIRVGGQWNAIPDVFGVRVGGWFESQSQDPAYLSVAPVGATRWGFGGGVVVRNGFLDVSVGYQRHMSAGLDNGGDGKVRAPAGTGPFNLNAEPPGVSAADRTQFRTLHAINGGSVTFDAHVFTLGGVVRF